MDIAHYHGFGWDKVHFHQRGSLDAMFWIFDENSHGNRGMFSWEGTQPGLKKHEEGMFRMVVSVFPSNHYM